MNSHYFKLIPGAPKSLSNRITRTVRFGECDPMRIVWHGHYAGYFESAREALALRYGITYDRFQEAGMGLVIKHIFIDYMKPLFFGGQYQIEAIQHWTEAARINLEYTVYDQQEVPHAKGYTVLLMVDGAGMLVLDPPCFYKNFIENWSLGRLT